MTDRPIYVLSVRAVLLILLGILLVGGAGGASVAWFLVQRVLREGGAGPRVVERVERVSGDGDLLVRVADDARNGVVGILSARGDQLQSGVALTADGIVVTPILATVPRSLQVLRADGSRLPAAQLRAYPEKGILFLRLAGSYPAPRFAADDALRPGRQGAALRVVPGASTIGVDLVTVTALAPPRPTRLREHPGLERLGLVSSTVPDGLGHGAPLFSSDGALLGVITRDREGAALLPVRDLDVLLQDVLRHPTGESVSILGGLRGTWLVGSEAKRLSLPADVAFRVDAVPALSPAGLQGLQAGDVVTGIDGKSFPAAGSLWAVLLEGARKGKPVTLAVRRDDADVTIAFTPRVSDGT